LKKKKKTGHDDSADLRKRAEEALRESEERFRAIVENAPFGYYRVGKDGLWQYVNPVWEQMHSLSLKEIIGKPFEITQPEDSVEQAREYVKRALAGETIVGEFGRLTREGNTKYHSFNIQPVKHGKEIVAIEGFINDITERNRAEEALRKSEEKYRGLTENIKLGIYRNTVGPEGKFIEANPTIIGMFGYKNKEEFLAINVSALYQNPEDRNKFNDKMLKEGFVRGEELWLKKKDGSLFVGSVSAVAVKDEQDHVKYYDGIIDDITERKQAEGKIQSLAKFPAENPDPILRIARDGTLLYINQAGLNLLPEWHLQVGKATPLMLREAVLQAMNNGLTRMLDLEQRRQIYSFSVVPIVDAGYANLYGRDVTERRKAEEALRKSESQLRAASLELLLVEERERKRLAMYLHDEIGQSLALLRMKFGSLAGAWESKSRKQDIHQVLDVLEKVIDQTHTLTFELSPPVLHQLGLEAAIEWAGEKISQDFGIEFMFSDDGMIKALDADIKALLFRCVRELMMNIVKHAKAKRMTVSLTRREERIFVVVEDDGVGFDMSLPGRQPEKVGFGLFSVRERLGAVGGTFELRSEPGRGTRVALSVLLKEERPSS
jgi:PAS domain S-box-containing protein